MTRTWLLGTLFTAGLLLAQTVPPGDGSTPLHQAVYQDEIETARRLIAAGADVRAATRIGAITPLLVAAKNGNPAMIKLLVDAGADPKSANAQGTTALMMAAAAGNAEAVNLLIDKGADVNARESAHGQTALMFASSLNRVAAVKALLAKGADPNVITRLTKLERIRVDIDGNPLPAEGERPIRKPEQSGGTAATSDSKEPDLQEKVAQLQALVVKLTARIDRLENPGSKPEEKPEEAPKTATGKAGDVAFLGPREMGTTLIGGMSALLFAARDGQLDAAKALVEGGANINQVAQSDRSSPLVTAIINGHFELANYLVGQGASPNLSNLAGLTPLIAAIDVQWAPHAWFPQPNLTQEKVGYLDLIKVLLDHGANPNARLEKKLWFRGLSQDPSWVDPAGATAFWRAAQSSDIDAMRLLMGRGADPNIATLSGATPLMVAAGIGWMANHTTNAPVNPMEAVKYCLQLGADVNAADSRGYTALHGAAYLGNNEMVSFLVDHGARVDVKSKSGDTVADMANGPTRFGIPHPETVAYLEKLGSANSHNCRSDQCLVAPKPEPPKPVPAKSITPNTLKDLAMPATAVTPKR